MIFSESGHLPRKIAAVPTHRGQRLALEQLPRYYNHFCGPWAALNRFTCPTVMWKEMQIRKYRWKYREISVIPAVCGTCKLEAGQVANGRRDKTGSCKATNEVE